VRAAYGDVTGHIFLISAVVALLGVLAAVLLKPVTLRTSLDLSVAKPAVDRVIVEASPDGATARN